ncbi:hypothetical protein O3M35_004335 [Rhynocoris fuscipes]|uniref:Uncharacterized protein n=1 Tax=Rhynocoris fuscipes TaxID=488301 RepID=A0AAW1CFN8_9HEMI
MDNIEDCCRFSREFISDEGKSFVFNVEFSLSAASNESAEQLSETLLAPQTLPSKFRRVLKILLTNYILNKMSEYDFKKRSSNSLLNKARIGENDKKWDSWIYCQQKSEVASNGKFEDLELFSAVYHKLIHSSALETILNVEHSYALVLQDIIKMRDQHLTCLSSKQTEEMSKAVEALSVGVTEADITAIANRHLDEHGIETASWQSKVSGIQQSQRSEYREWLMSLFQHNTDSPISTPLNSPIIVNRNFAIESQAPMLQESYTIHLGSQMKHMYNIRLLSADVLDFCKPRTSPSGNVEPQPQRLQTALALYSNDLCGIVLLSDNHLGNFSGITKDLINVCECLPELHFSSIEDQLEDIRNSVKEVVDWRRACTNSTENTLLTVSEQMSRKSATKYLQSGDVYVTKHSNLSEVHVVFHMVIDDTVRSSDISSRHSGILGLRNIIKCACLNDITTLTVPLLLTHDNFQGMNMSWCTKRAELIFKCVKGFMIEMSSWGRSELKTLQFLVPKGINEEIFTSLATMLPSIFRISNPLVLEASHSNRNHAKK